MDGLEWKTPIKMDDLEVYAPIVGNIQIVSQKYVQNI